MAMGSAEEVCSRPGRNCGGEPLRPDVRVSTVGMIGDGTPGPGLSVLMVLAALIVSVEHRYRTIGTTFMVTPRRSVVLLAKMTIAAGVVELIQEGVRTGRNPSTPTSCCKVVGFVGVPPDPVDIHWTPDFLAALGLEREQILRVVRDVRDVGV